MWGKEPQGGEVGAGKGLGFIPIKVRGGGRAVGWGEGTSFARDVGGQDPNYSVFPDHFRIQLTMWVSSMSLNEDQLHRRSRPGTRASPQAVHRFSPPPGLIRPGETFAAASSSATCLSPLYSLAVAHPSPAAFSWVDSVDASCPELTFAHTIPFSRPINL